MSVRRIIFLALVIALIMVCCSTSAAGYKEWVVRYEGIRGFASLSDGGIILAVGNRVIKLDDTGTQRWQWAADSTVDYIVSDYNGAAFVVFGRTLARLDSSGRQVWRADTYGKAYSLALLEGNLFVGWEFGLLKFSLSGNLLWEYYRPEDC